MRCPRLYVMKPSLLLVVLDLYHPYATRSEEGHTHTVRYLCQLPDGRLLSGTGNK